MFRVSKYVVPVFVIMTFILACSLSAPSKNSQEDDQIPVTGEQTPLVVAVPTEQPPQPTAEPTATDCNSRTDNRAFAHPDHPPGQPVCHTAGG